MAKRRLTAADFDAVRGTANDVKAFRKFVEQEGAASRELVDEVIARGAARMKKAAWLCLAELDLPGAEAKALAAAEGVETIQAKKWKKELIEPLLFLSTTACLDRYEALGVEVLPDSLADQAFVRAQTWAIALMLRCPEVEGQEAVLEEWFPEYRRVPNTLALLRGIVRHESLLARRSVWEILIEGADLEACRADDLPEEFAIEARFALPPPEAFERLRPFFEANPSQHGAVIRALARQRECDPRWVEMFASVDDQALRTSGLLATCRPEALALLAPLIREMEPGPALLEALTELRGFDSPEAAELFGAVARTQRARWQRRAARDFTARVWNACARGGAAGRGEAQPRWRDVLSRGRHSHSGALRAVSLTRLRASSPCARRSRRRRTRWRHRAGRAPLPA